MPIPEYHFNLEMIRNGHVNLTPSFMSTPPSVSIPPPNIHNGENQSPYVNHIIKDYRTRTSNFRNHNTSGRTTPKHNTTIIHSPRVESTRVRQSNDAKQHRTTAETAQSNSENNLILSPIKSKNSTSTLANSHSSSSHQERKVVHINYDYTMPTAKEGFLWGDVAQSDDSMGSLYPPPPSDTVPSPTDSPLLIPCDPIPMTPPSSNPCSPITIPLSSSNSEVNGSTISSKSHPNSSSNRHKIYIPPGRRRETSTSSSSPHPPSGTNKFYSKVNVNSKDGCPSSSKSSKAYFSSRHSSILSTDQSIISGAVNKSEQALSRSSLNSASIKESYPHSHSSSKPSGTKNKRNSNGKTVISTSNKSSMESQRKEISVTNPHAVNNSIANSSKALPITITETSTDESNRNEHASLSSKPNPNPPPFISKSKKRRDRKKRAMERKVQNNQNQGIKYNNDTIIPHHHPAAHSLGSIELITPPTSRPNSCVQQILLPDSSDATMNSIFKKGEMDGSYPSKMEQSDIISEPKHEQKETFNGKNLVKKKYKQKKYTRKKKMKENK